ncbi:M20/M25/M40 family metallo-hydrolase [Cellulomonas fimi]|uniref:M20/M25/M40 family metallo-hydrolase n=1 Tax=Cellulomonas fimi TaxID=1708 RepID=A0A7Y0LZE7_CELFI|nr:M20/M25/M40 family metallo-hydrolase [Cellulomonas fimi]NMR21011.1 M20/M25/M40 family metallo-hydrolase [Cellulomonas fimi]
MAYGALATAMVATISLTAPATATPGKPDLASRMESQVRLPRVLDHIEELQEIADENGGTRASGTPGYQASVDYVVLELRRAGYRAEVQEFMFQYEEDNSSFEQVSPTPTTYVNGEDFVRNAFTDGPQAEATGTVVPVNLTIPPPAEAGTSPSGCEAADFAGFPAGAIALIQRGTCNFDLKALNAQTAGAAGVIIMNEGQPNRTDVPGMGGEGSQLTIPVIGVTFDLGVQLAQTPGVMVRIDVSFLAEQRPTYNVIAQTRFGDPDNVVMAGAHLDSDMTGPGISDNGSGSAALLEVAKQIGRSQVPNAVRFAWWGAEESGLLGSEYYVQNLTGAEKDQLALYLNFDMVASPNYFFGIFDGDDSGGTAVEDGVVIPEGSAAIEEVFQEFYADRGHPFDDSEFSGQSDYQEFILNDIPAGGLFTGAGLPKTEEQVAKYGGLAGVPYDPCYHACDSLDDDALPDDPYTELRALYELQGNVNLRALDVNSDAIAYAVATLATDTSAVNGVVTPDDRPIRTPRNATLRGGDEAAMLS